MSLFLVVFPVMLLLVAAMAIGVIFGRKPIAGTCGGLNMMGEDGVCELCGGRLEACEAETAEAPTDTPTPVVRDAMKG